MNIFLKTFVFFYTRLIEGLEKKIGYRLTFTHIPDTWVNGWMSFNMEKSWAKHGIRAWGLNYFTVGALENGVSTRYVRNKKQYQSWLGAYLVTFKDKREFTLQDHFNLANADQENWLEGFGDPHPYSKMQAEKAASPELVDISGYPAKLYWFSGGLSHSDVGTKSNNLRNKILMALMSSMFNFSNPRLHLKGSNFIPTHIHSEYESVTLKGYAAIIDLEADTKIVLYGNGAAIVDPEGSEVRDYSPELKDDILAAFKGVKIEKL